MQLAFWLHMIVVTYVEVRQRAIESRVNGQVICGTYVVLTSTIWRQVRRSDFWMMMLHHCITSWLVATSYMMNYVSKHSFQLL